MTEQVSQIDFNGKYQSSSSLNINDIQRALVYGDCVFEHFRTNASKILFFGRHIDKLCAAMSLLNMDIPKKFSTERAVLKDELSKLLIKNKIFKGGLLTLLAFRKGGSELLPQNAETEYIAMVNHMPTVLYELNKQALSLCIYDEIPMPSGHIANVNTHAGSLVKNLAAQHARKMRTTDALVVNTQGNIVESALHGNVFCVKDSVLYTPPLSEGCCDSVIRHHVLDVADTLGIQVDVKTNITLDFLKVVDEIFLASTEFGIVWVGALQNRRFYRRTAETILNKLNDYYSDEF